MKAVHALALPILCGSSLACGQASPSEGAAPLRRSDSVSVSVVNQNFYDANVYAFYEGQQVRRLGMVSGFSTDTFKVAWNSAPLRMRMRFVGAAGTLSNELLVNPGDVVELLIQPDAHRRRPIP